MQAKFWSRAVKTNGKMTGIECTVCSAAAARPMQLHAHGRDDAAMGVQRLCMWDIVACCSASATATPHGGRRSSVRRDLHGLAAVGDAGVGRQLSRAAGVQSGGVALRRSSRGSRRWSYSTRCGRCPAGCCGTAVLRGLGAARQSTAAPLCDVTNGCAAGSRVMSCDARLSRIHCPAPRSRGRCSTTPR
jgi:hypothetical protein